MITSFLWTDREFKKSEGLCDSSEEFEVEDNFASFEMPPSASDSIASVSNTQITLDQEITSELQQLFDKEDYQVNHYLPEVSVKDKEGDRFSIFDELSKKVDYSRQFFIVTRREAPLERVLQIWLRAVGRNPSGITGTLSIKFIGENGIDSGALSKEFLSEQVQIIDTVMF